MTKIFAAIRAANADAVNTLSSLTFWLIIAGVTAICFLSGPFGTIDALPWGIRLVYWAMQVITAGIAGVWTHFLIRTQGWTGFTLLLSVSLAFGVVVFVIVVLFSLALLEPIGKYPGALDLLLYSFPSASLIFLLLALIVPVGAMTDAIDEAEMPTRPKLFDRLKKHRTAGHILSLSAQDHYVEVFTDAGAELCLIRLADAIVELAPEQGFQIHRSHWVALSAITSLDTNGSSAEVTLSDGRTLPVSQSRLSDLRKLLSTAHLTCAPSVSPCPTNEG